MTHKYERQCWNCNSRDLEDKGDHVKCRSCGATWNPVSQISGPLTEPGNITRMVNGEATSIRAKHPSGGVKRWAAKARRAVTPD